jgi:hypothetical protein
MIKLTGNERNEVRYRPRAKKKDQLVSLLMSRCLYQYYPFSFFLSSVFLSVRWDMKENKQCIEFEVKLYFSSYLLLSEFSNFVSLRILLITVFEFGVKR